MKVVPAPDGFGVHVTFAHTCGHDVPMFYAAEKFAIPDQEREEKQVCIHCRIAQDIMWMKAEEGNVPTLRERLLLPKGYKAKWVNAPKPTGRYRSFDRGALPTLIVTTPTGDEVAVCGLGGDTQYGANKLVDGAECHAYLVTADAAPNRRLKKTGRNVKEAQAIVEVFLAGAYGQQLLQARVGIIPPVQVVDNS
jgi:hypothetical protein